MFRKRRNKETTPEGGSRQQAGNVPNWRIPSHDDASDPRSAPADRSGPQSMQVHGQDERHHLRDQGQSAPVATSAAQHEQECRRLVVGRDICLSGEIKACDALTVEGRVEANLADGKILEISESGFFKGSAVVDRCSISGCFDGDLVVHDFLRLTETARVSGAVYYGDIEITRGARIRGLIEPVEDENVAEMPLERALTEEAQRADLARIRIKPQFPRSMKEILDAVEGDLESGTSGSVEPSSGVETDSSEDIPEGVARISISPKQRRSE